MGELKGEILVADAKMSTLMLYIILAASYSVHNAHAVQFEQVLSIKGNLT